MSNINLLPPQIKEAIDQRRKNAQARHIFIRVVFLNLAVILLTGAFYLYMNDQSRAATKAFEKAERSIEGYGQLEQEAARISERINAVKTIEKKLYSWHNVIAELRKVMPSGVYLSKVSLSADSKNRATVAGFAKSNEAVAALRDALENSDYFSFVDIESTSTEVDPKTKKELESFSLTFSLTKEALND